VKPFAVALVVALLPISVSPAHAQYGTDVLFFPVNARTLSMALSGVADNTDPSGIWSNPANVVSGEQIYGMGSWVGFDGLDDVSLWRGDAGGSWKFDDTSAWTFGASASFARLRVDFFNDYVNDVLSFALGAGFTHDRIEFRFGASIKRLSAELPGTWYLATEELDGTAYNLGFAVGGRGDGAGWDVVPQFGLATIDRGEDMEGSYFESELPRRLNAGGSLRVQGPAVTVIGTQVPVFAGVINADAVTPQEGDTYGALGSEAVVAQMLFLRAGLAVLPNNAEDEFTWGVGIGVPVHSLRIRFDYCEEQYGIADEHFTLLATWSL
jgi:hypothetical protein